MDDDYVKPSKQERNRRITETRIKQASDGWKEIPATAEAIEQELRNVNREHIKGHVEVSNLRAREVRFCHAYFDGATWAGAYRDSHPTENDSEAVVKQKAIELSKQPRIQAYLQHLQDREVAKNSNTVHVEVTPGVNATSPILELKAAMDKMEDESIAISMRGQMKKLEIIYWYAMAQGKYNAAIGAVKAQNELAGFLTQRHEISVKSIADASDEDLDAMAEEAERELLELGLDPKSGVWSTPEDAIAASIKRDTMRDKAKQTRAAKAYTNEVAEDEGENEVEEEPRTRIVKRTKPSTGAGGGNAAALEAQAEDKAAMGEDGEDWS